MATFLDLPAELRNRVYHLSLVRSGSISGSCIWIPLGPRSGGELRYEGLTEPRLLYTSSQICSEALPIFYGANRFKIYGGMSLRLWMQRLRVEGVGMLRTIYLEMHGHYDARSPQDAHEKILAVKKHYLEGHGIEVADGCLPLLEKDGTDYFTNGV